MTNIVINGNFDAGLTNWITEDSVDGGVTWTSPGNIGVASGQGIGGTDCAGYTLPIGLVVRLKQEAISVMENESYAIQYYARRDLNVPEAGIANVFTIYESGTNIVIYQSSPSLASSVYDANAAIFTIPAGITKIDLVIQANYFELSPQPSPKEAFYVDEISIIQYLICFSGKSVVMARDQETGTEGWVRVDCLDPNRHLAYRTDTREYVPVLRVIQAGRTKSYLAFRVDIFGPGKPHEEFWITGGHRIVYQGVETKARNLPSRKRRHLKEPDPVYTLVCEDHCPLLINGLEVIAYGREEWERSRTMILSANITETCRL